MSFFVSSTRSELKNFFKLIFKDLIESCNFTFRDCDIKVSTVMYCGRNKSVREVSPWERVKDIPVFTGHAWGVWFEYSWKKTDGLLDFWKLWRPCEKTFETVGSKWYPQYSMSVVFLGLEYSCRVNKGFSKDLWAHGESENYLHYHLGKSS